MKPNERHWIYIVLCNNDAYYTGITTNIALRYRMHCDKTSGAKYILQFGAQKLLRVWTFVGAVGDALRVERLIKKLPRKKKDALITRPNGLLPLCEKAGLRLPSLTTFSAAKAMREAAALTPKAIRMRYNPFERFDG